MTTWWCQCCGQLTALSEFELCDTCERELDDKSDEEINQCIVSHEKYLEELDAAGVPVAELTSLFNLLANEPVTPDKLESRRDYRMLNEWVESLTWREMSE